MARTVQELVAEARGRIEEIAPDRLVAQRSGIVIDVREPAEYAQGHLPGAINLPRGVLEFQIHAHPAMACTTSEALAVPDRDVVLYCLTGGRSALAAESLQSLGFTRVRSLAGGLIAWRNAGHPLTTEPA
ncbi:rhodanese-like domain-containing protein [Pseudoxanthomonas japonensis]|uniref:rhodanese-like domain-containing protein n=1 Tax=Pseudoxanthomonas japonensis TaxID=69284 RepID=UPI0037485AF7